MNFLDAIWLIPLFPLLGAVTMLLVGRRLDPQPPSPVAVSPEVAAAAGFPEEEADHAGHHRPPPGRSLISLLCPGTVLLSLIFSIGAVVQLARSPEKWHQVIQYTWLAGFPFHLHAGAIAHFGADLGFLLDPLSGVMILTVCFVAFFIHVYSIGYMGHETGYYRFFGYLNLFVFFMLMLVLANNYVLMFVGWEGVGLCSYLLIGFDFHRKAAADAGKKAFIANRVGDAGFILGMLLLFSVVGTVRFVDVNRAVAGFPVETGTFGVISAITLLLFIGATGKSAQIPLYVWLPDAMEGPTPVSALIHAATMVTAGVYMVARSNALYALAPTTSGIVATIGAVTAIFAASIALVQNDIKRVLAYSTISQLGYMFLAAGVGAYWVAIFHLYTHAFFKALLFLCAGSVMHAMSGELDMRRMGGLKNKIPITHATMLVATLAIAGIPGFAGFFSKDEILAQAWSSPLGSKWLWAIGVVTAFLTALYMWRLMSMTFYGSSRVDKETEKHIHEAPRSMTVPLTVLAAGSALGGWVGVPKLWSWFGDSFRLFERYLAPVWSANAVRAVTVEAHAAGAHEVTTEWLLMGLSVVLAIAGILVARYLYVVKPAVADRVQEASGPVYKILLNKYYVDELYDFLFINGLGKGGGRVLGEFDRRIVDGGVNGAGWMTRLTSRVSGWWDTWIVDGTVRLVSFLVKLSSYPVRVFQSGSVQQYGLVILAAVAVVLGYYLMQ